MAKVVIIFTKLRKIRNNRPMIEQKKPVFYEKKPLYLHQPSQSVTPKQLILGADPGFFGALAIYDMTDHDLIFGCDMPLKTKINRSDNNEIDGKKLKLLLQPYAPFIRRAVVERVHARPEEGVVSVFRFGEGYGILNTIIDFLEIPRINPPSSVWKPELGLTFDKKKSVAKARLRFKRVQEETGAFLTSKDGRAEAALLAMYGAQIYSKPDLNSLL